jgi:thiosulfate/3-mercaptopyruvate sulfurtransferase
MRWKHACPWLLLLTLFLAIVACPVVLAQESVGASSSATSIPESRLIQPEALVQLLKAGEKEKPTILQVGSRVMFSQAHIPGSEYAGPGSQTSGIQSLENTVASLPKEKQIILYCGCCPWNRCPNVGPAYKRLHDLGFTNVKVLYIANNFGDDWVNKGYPAVKGK